MRLNFILLLVFGSLISQGCKGVYEQNIDREKFFTYFFENIEQDKLFIDRTSITLSQILTQNSDFELNLEYLRNAFETVPSALLFNFDDIFSQEILDKCKTAINDRRTFIEKDFLGVSKSIILTNKDDARWKISNPIFIKEQQTAIIFIKDVSEYGTGSTTMRVFKKVENQWKVAAVLIL